MYRHSIYNASLLIIGLASVIFVYSGFQKITNPMPFIQAITKHGLAHPGMQWVTSLSIIEIITGIALVFGLLSKSLRAYTTLTGTAVLGAFSLYLFTIMVLRGPYLDCGCSGILKFNIAGALARNMFFMLATLYVFVAELRTQGPRNPRIKNRPY